MNQRRRPFRSILPAAAQPAIACMVLGGLMLAPPAAGRMLLLPLTGAAGRALPAAALADGALLIGAGPLPGSLIVESRAAGLPARLIGMGVVAVSTTAGGCGTGGEGIT